MRSERVDGPFAVDSRIVFADHDVGFGSQFVLDDFGHFGHQAVGEAHPHLDGPDAVAVWHPHGGAGEPAFGGTLGTDIVGGTAQTLFVLRAEFRSHQGQRRPIMQRGVGDEQRVLAFVDLELNVCGQVGEQFTGGGIG